jgi:hypothetical protein
MKQILVIDVSPRGTESANRRVAKTLTDRLLTQYPSAKIIHRDFAKDNLPHLDEMTLKAISTNNAAEALRLKESALLSDQFDGRTLGVGTCGHRHPNVELRNSSISQSMDRSCCSSGQDIFLYGERCSGIGKR